MFKIIPGLHDGEFNTVESHAASVAVEPGRAVSLGASGLTIGGAAAIGVVVHALGAQYKAKSVVPVLTRGSAYVELQGTAAVGDVLGVSGDGTFIKTGTKLTGLTVVVRAVQGNVALVQITPNS